MWFLILLIVVVFIVYVVTKSIVLSILVSLIIGGLLFADAFSGDIGIISFFSPKKKKLDVSKLP